ncbi:hypothetical protein DFH06DRAFT_1147582 [Mycena polygramma]|nr:hypothetical protein DFH06DRAFT_1147582 [Mycena polygramma]
MTPRVAEHSEDLGAAESADSAGLIGIGGGNAGDGTGTEGQRTIRTDRTCGSWKAGKCREPGGNPEGEGVSEDERDTEVKPEKNRRDRRTTIEEGEDIQRGRMRMEVAGASARARPVRSTGITGSVGIQRGGQRLTLRHMAVREAEVFRSGRKAAVLGKVGNGKLQRKYGVAKGDKMKVRAGAGTGTKSWKQERCWMGYREGIRKAEGKPEVLKRKTEDRKAGVSAEEKGEDGKPPSSSGSDSGPRPRKPKPERELENYHIVEFGLGSETAQAGTGRKEGMWKETKDILVKSQNSMVHHRERFNQGRRELGRRTGSEVENSDREWNEKSRSLMDQYSISEARRVQLSRRSLAEGNGLETRRLVEGKVNAKSSKVGSEVGSGEIREADEMEEAAKGMGNRNNEKGRNLREMHGEDPMGRTTQRKSSTCSETTNSESASRRFGSEESEVGRCVRNRKSSAESVVGIRNPEAEGRIRNDRGEDQRMTAQEVLVQSESANNSCEEKSEIIGKARKFEMPIPPLRSQRGRRVKGEKLGQPETRQWERRGATAGVQRDWWSIQACEGPKEPRLPTRFRKSQSISQTKARRRLERPKRMRECSEEFRWPERPKRNMTRRNRRTERVRKAMMDDGEYRRDGRGGKAMKPKLQGVPNGTRSRWKISERKDELEGAEQFPAKGCRPELKCTELEKPKSRMSLSEARPRSGMAGQDPGTSDAQPKTATVFGRRLEPSSEGENGKETANGGVQPRTIPDALAEASIGRSEVTNGRLESEPRKGDERRTEIRSGSESSEGKETRKEQREEVAMESTRESAGGMFTKNEKPGGGPSKAPKVWWSLGRCRPEGVTEVRRIRTKVGRWNSSEEQNGMVKQSSEVTQQICSNHIPTEIFGDIRICGGFKARCSEPKPSQDREFREEFAERARGMVTEHTGGADQKPEVSRTKLRRLDGTVGDVGQRGDRSPEDADKMSGGGTVRKQGPKGRTELRSDAAGAQ